MTTQEKPQILVNLNESDSILSSPRKKLSSIIENISNFIFNNNFVLPVYTTDLKQSRENIEKPKENIEKPKENIEKPKEKIDIEDIKHNTDILFLNWDLEAQQYRFK
jgi:hypothetical protein